MEQIIVLPHGSSAKSEPYQKGYLLLFNTVTDALKQMEQLNFGQAKQLLKEGQQKAEEFFLSGE